MFSHCWFLLLVLAFDGLYAWDSRSYAKLPLLYGEGRPFLIVVHVWVSRLDTGEHSCIGIRHRGNRIFVPEWCVTVDGEKRGRIAIYAPKSAGKITSFPRASPSKRYDEQFNFLYQDDDLRRIIEAPDGSIGTDKPNIVILKIPKIMNEYVALFWLKGDIFSKNATSMVVSWKQGPNGEFFFVKRPIDDSIKQKKSFEGLKEGAEDIAEAVLSVDHIDKSIIFEGFFKQSPEMSEIDIRI